MRDTRKHHQVTCYLFFCLGLDFSHVTVGAYGGPRGCFAVLIDDGVTPHVVFSVEIRSLIFLYKRQAVSWQSRWIFPEALSDFRDFVEAFQGIGK